MHMENQNLEPSLKTDTLALGTERFSSLSSEMVSLLEDLNREVHRSALELKDVQAAVDAGKRELDALCEIEKETSTLERQIEDLRRQKEMLQRLIADQQSTWEEEKTKRAGEEREYEENLKAQRQREEEAYRLRWENEQITVRQKLEEELGAMRQKSAEVHAAEEKDILARSAALNKKERELALLMQELEKFLSGLSARIGTAGQAVPDAMSRASTGLGQGGPVFFGLQDELKGGFNPGNALMWQEEGEEKGS
jgi:hypothetical protein